ncbi:hypothetical protein FAM18175_00375 [Lacticaseibacillus paracasei]|nr:hypothetical protein FAM18175_00375 [Lacticaseibacillus paracasei]
MNKPKRYKLSDEQWDRIALLFPPTVPVDHLSFPTRRLYCDFLAV